MKTKYLAIFAILLFNISFLKADYQYYDDVAFVAKGNSVFEKQKPEAQTEKMIEALQPKQEEYRKKTLDELGQEKINNLVLGRVEPKETNYVSSFLKGLDNMFDFNSELCFSIMSALLGYSLIMFFIKKSYPTIQKKIYALQKEYENEERKYVLKNLGWKVYIFMKKLFFYICFFIFFSFLWWLIKLYMKVFYFGAISTGMVAGLYFYIAWRIFVKIKEK